jgi:hypothetical protein
MHRLSSGKLVSERIVELLDEVEQRGLVAAEIILGSRAMQLLKSEVNPELTVKVSHIVNRRYFSFQGVEVSESEVESAEYVGIENHF